MTREELEYNRGYRYGYERGNLNGYKLRKSEEKPCEDAVSRKKIEKLKRWRFPYDTNTTIPKSDLFVKLTDIRALPPVTPTQRWTPCSERLPKERGMYIVTEKVFSVTDKEHAGGFNLMTEQVEFDNGKWRRASFYEVIAWMPLLKPYQEERECCSDCKHHTDAEEIHG